MYFFRFDLFIYSSSDQTCTESFYRLENKMLELLLKAGAQINARNIVGDAPLHKAALNGRTVSADFLIRAGADVNIRYARLEGGVGTGWACSVKMGRGKQGGGYVCDHTVLIVLLWNCWGKGLFVLRHDTKKNRRGVSCLGLCWTVYGSVCRSGCCLFWSGDGEYIHPQYTDLFYAIIIFYGRK